MAHTQNEGTSFGYFQSGIQVAQIRFADGEVWQRKTGWETAI